MSEIASVEHKQILKALQPFMGTSQPAEQKEAGEAMPEIIGKVKMTAAEILRKPEANPIERLACVCKLRRRRPDWTIDRILEEIAKRSQWENYSPDETRKKLESPLLKKYFASLTPLQKSWAQLKADARYDYTQTGKIAFPTCTNFSEDITVNSKVEDKTPLWLVVPFISQKKDGGKGLFFLDETQQANTVLINEDGLRENFYEFACKHKNLPLILFSKEPLSLNDSEVHVEGLQLTIKDWRKIGESAHLPSMKDILLVHKFSKAQVKVEEILSACSKLESEVVFKENFFSIFRHPDWFEDLNCAFQLHKPFDYPMHLLMADCEGDEAQGGGGKTELLERHNLVDGTPIGIFSLGTTGTVKGLTLNFKSNRLETGYLLNVPAVAKVDEFFSCLESEAGKEKSQQQDFFKMLNDLWEWRIRTSQSGNTPATTIAPRFRAIIAGNLPKGIPDMFTLSQQFNAPFLERNVCYFFSKEHRLFVENARAKVEQERKKGLHAKVGVPIGAWLDFVRSIRIDYPPEVEQKLQEAFEAAFTVRVSERTLSPVLSNRRLASIFKARYRHHINCLWDGLLKLKHLPELNTAVREALTQGKELEKLLLEPNEADYAALDRILEEVVRSWMPADK